MDVLVDDRERKKIYKKIAKNVDGNAIWMRLDVGDVQIGDVTIERKSWSDFIASFFSKRMWEQAEKLAQCEHPIIVIHGDPFESLMKRRSGRVPPIQTWMSILGAITSLSVTYGIPVITLPRDADFYHLVKIIYKKKTKDGSATGRPIAFKRKKRTPQAQAEDMLTMIEGVGRKAAREMLEYSGSIADLVEFDEEDLKRIDGVGKKGAEKIYDVLNSDFNE